MAEFYHHGELLSVMTTQPLGRALDYRAPEGGCHAGAFVEVPLGPRKVMGVVWGPGAGDYDINKVRHVIRVLDAPPMRDEMREFLLRSAAYTLTPLPAMLRLATRAPGLGDPPSMRKIYRAGDGVPTRMTDARQRVMAVLEEYGDLAFTLKELSEMAGVTSSVVKGLVDQGAVREEESPRDLPFRRLDPSLPGKALTEDQATAAAVLREGIKAETYGTTLLRGVTGSGKTEVYLEAVAAAVQSGRQALVLLPEIALTEQFLDRVEERFGAKPAEWHSGVTMTERRRIWRMVGEGNAQLVIGARSALFLPFARLGLIVVDEAHETSFKQEEGVRYNARDVAVMRGHFEQVPVVLASATPALESLQMAESGIYAKIDLPSRYGGAQMPTIETIDLTEEKPPQGMWLAQRLVDGIEARLERGEQSLLFLNRRGYAPLTLCRNCGFRYQCPNCSAWLVEHRFTGRLACHHCGHEAPAPKTCTECDEPDCLVACGPGVERIADEVAERLPQARVFVATSDTLNSPGKAAEFIAAVEAREVDVIVGTQLVTKGFHFPELTLVGVVDADLGLEGGDLRAGERTYQQVAQVAGRAGRGSKPGEVLLQTRHPDAPVIAALAAGDRDAFYSAETEMRREAGAPPFGRWASIIISSEDDAEAREAANRIGAFRPDVAECMILGPAPAPMALLRGRYRYRFLINARRSVQLQQVIRRWLAAIDHPPGVRVAVDIDPYSFV